MNTQEKIGQIVKRLRQERHLSQEQLSSQCGIDQHYISNIESGQRNVSVEVVERLASFFNLSLSSFFLTCGSGKGSSGAGYIHYSCLNS